MTHEQWAKEVARILEYWYGEKFDYFKDETYKDTIVVYGFQCGENSIYLFKCSFDDYPNVVNAAIYLTEWFESIINV